jgi:CRP-like cAMP-binding protein
MHSHSAESLPSAATTSVKSANGATSAAQPEQVRASATSATTLPVMSNLRSPFLAGLTQPELNSILEQAEYRKLPANHIVVNQDDSAEHLFLLLTGRARFFVITEKGQKIIHLWIPPGAVIGVATILSPPCRYLVSTETVRNSSVLVWNRATIRTLAAQHPKLFENALTLSLQYLTAYHAAHMALICGSARERLAHVLVTLARGIGQQVGDGIELSVRNEELANEANVTLFTASRLLNEWKRAGILMKNRGKILLRAPELLLRHVASDAA